PWPDGSDTGKARRDALPRVAAIQCVKEFSGTRADVEAVRVQIVDGHPVPEDVDVTARTLVVALDRMPTFAAVRRAEDDRQAPAGDAMLAALKREEVEVA